METVGGDKYTASDGQRLLQDLNLTQQAAVYPRVKELIQPIVPLQARQTLCRRHFMLCCLSTFAVVAILKLCI